MVTKSSSTHFGPNFFKTEICPSLGPVDVFYVEAQIKAKVDESSEDSSDKYSGDSDEDGSESFEAIF
ncbi:hypothetical protein KSP39_PZI016457 [Platanthera zijinensis]|uniref:Uncharacterized protein n=1 Tax=Platanthera zijinensis TaxID=2320716 RepID=A0AAP0B685_9ASPA